MQGHLENQAKLKELRNYVRMRIKDSKGEEQWAKVLTHKVESHRRPKTRVKTKRKGTNMERPHLATSLQVQHLQTREDNEKNDQIQASEERDDQRMTQGDKGGQ
jgi:hypothetical protein